MSHCLHSIDGDHIPGPTAADAECVYCKAAQRGLAGRDVMTEPSVKTVEGRAAIRKLWPGGGAETRAINAGFLPQALDALDASEHRISALEAQLAEARAAERERFISEGAIEAAAKALYYQDQGDDPGWECDEEGLRRDYRSCAKAAMQSAIRALSDPGT